MRNFCVCLRQEIGFIIFGLLFCSAITSCGDSSNHSVIPNGRPVTSNSTMPFPGMNGGFYPGGAGSAVNMDPWGNILQEGQAGQVMLPIGPIYDQGMSGWCWAFSAFHTIRTYYYDTAATDPATLEWRAAISSIDSTKGLKSYLKGKVGSLIGGLTGGDPENFIKNFQKAKGLPPQQWRSIDTDDTAAAFSQVEANLRQHIPSVYCDREHCKMIYGFVTNGMQVTEFAIGDSAADPNTYLESVAKLGDSLDELVTLVPY